MVAFSLILAGGILIWVSVLSAIPQFGNTALDFWAAILTGKTPGEAGNPAGGIPTGGPVGSSGGRQL